MLDRKLYKIKNYPSSYKKKLKRINRTRERLNVVNYIANVFNDLEDAYYDYLAYGDPLRDMYGQVIDKTSDEYLYDVDPNWLEYLGQTWTLQDELDYCNKCFANRDIEYKMFDKLKAECATKKTLLKRKLSIILTPLKKHLIARKLILLKGL